VCFTSCFGKWWSKLQISLSSFNLPCFPWSKVPDRQMNDEGQSWPLDWNPFSLESDLSSFWASAGLYISDQDPTSRHCPMGWQDRSVPSDPDPPSKDQTLSSFGHRPFWVDLGPSSKFPNSKQARVWSALFGVHVSQIFLALALNRQVPNSEQILLGSTYLEFTFRSFSF